MGKRLRLTDTTKVCGSCGIEKPHRAFNKKGSRLSSRCKKCLTAKEKNDWLNQTPRFVRRREALRKRYYEGRKLLDDLRNVPCQDCGGRFPHYVMDFDHLDKREKQYTVSCMLRYSREKILAEVAKCDIVCANCHRIRTFGS